MLEVKLSLNNFDKTIFNSYKCLLHRDIELQVEAITGLSSKEFYIVYNGKLIGDSDICDHGLARVVPRLFGGKGGFGSMLRAIGAQIEKTTNREACRDLSGRRLRDINEEKRLKAWIEKQGTRDEETVERKKKKLARLCAQPKHEFKDKNYEYERSALTEKVEDAVEEGFKMAVASGSTLKRKADDNPKSKRPKLALDSDIDSDELVSSSDDDDSNSPKPRTSEQGSLQTSECGDSGSQHDSDTRCSPEATEEHQDLARQQNQDDNSETSIGVRRTDKTSRDIPSKITQPEIK